MAVILTRLAIVAFSSIIGWVVACFTNQRVPSGPMEGYIIHSGCEAGGAVALLSGWYLQNIWSGLGCAAVAFFGSALLFKSFPLNFRRNNPPPSNPEK